MGGIDKLAATVSGRPLLAWTLAALAAAPEVERIVVVVAPATEAAISSRSWLPAKVRAVVAGGERRQESVEAGLRAIERLDAGLGDRGRQQARERVVLVHDGARPAISTELIAAVVAAADLHGAAIPVTPVVETMKRVEAGIVKETIDRESLGAAQTPQGVRHGILRAAFDRFPASGPRTWTDEASLLEACTIDVHAIPGDPTNLKVTTPDDFRRAEAILVGRAGTAGLLGEAAGTPGPLGDATGRLVALAPPRLRIGFGDDSHPFGPGDGLALGGISIEGAPRLHGHSDGDVALHAIAGALLGAAGLGDLGRLFPAGPRTPSGIASSELLREVVRQLASAGLRPSSVDITIVGARPRLGRRLDAMRDAIGELLGIPAERVSVKASTGNLLGAEGMGRAISARAVALVEVSEGRSARGHRIADRAVDDGVDSAGPAADAPERAEARR